MNTKVLVKGMVIKNYKELCKLLNQKECNGNSRKAQLKEFERYFAWEKSGQKYIITEIYDKPLPSTDKRKQGNNSIYVKYIEVLLLSFLAQKEEYTYSLQFTASSGRYSVLERPFSEANGRSFFS